MISVRTDAQELLFYVADVHLQGNRLRSLPTVVVGYNFIDSRWRLFDNPWECSCDDDSGATVRLIKLMSRNNKGFQRSFGAFSENLECVAKDQLQLLSEDTQRRNFNITI